MENDLDEFAEEDIESWKFQIGEYRKMLFPTRKNIHGSRISPKSEPKFTCGKDIEEFIRGSTSYEEGIKSENSVYRNNRRT